jgi:predicted DCC family thiol-disulfide oxidoreductase YuxK
VNNRWTGGQYSVFRVLFGAYLFVHFAHLVPWGREMFSSEGVLPGSASPLLHLFPNLLALSDSPWVVRALLLAGVGLAVVFALGFHDRVASVLLWYVWACLFGRNPLISNPGLPYVGWMLLAHACVPRAPYGSWDRRTEADPGSQWRMPPALFAVAWALMALGYSYSGYTKLASPSWLEGTAVHYVLMSPLARPGWLRGALLGLPAGVLQLLSFAALGMELGFAPLALFRWMRPWLWGALLCLHLSLIALIGFADLSLGMVLLHFFTFNPAWIAPRRAGTEEWMFYDGHCGLCHRAVRFVLSEDLDAHFRFAPLQSERFRASLSEEVRRSLPDSLVVLTADGRMFYRSAGILYLMRAMGGLWRAVAAVAGRIPAPLLDAAYDGIARVRYKLFAQPAEACPILPPYLRSRFDA